MVYVLMRDGRSLEVQEALSAQVDAGQLVFRNADGHIVTAMKAEEVSAYGDHAALAQQAQLETGARPVRAD